MPKYFFMPSNLDAVLDADFSEEEYKMVEKQIRKALRNIGKNLLKKTTEEYNKYNPEIGKSSFITGKGSNQYQGKIKLGYSHKEASDIEEGTEVEQVTGVYVQRVKEHKRKLGQGGKPKTRKARMKQAITSRLRKKPPRETKVKSHKREYKNKKLVQLKSGEWRIVGKLPARKGKGYLKKAIEESFDSNAIAKEIKQAMAGIAQ